MAIGVDAVQLRNAAARVDGIAGNFRTEIDNLGRLVNETGNYMQGGPQSAFEEKYAEFNKVMENFIGALNAYSKAMKDYADDTDHTTQVGTQRFTNI